MSSLNRYLDLKLAKGESYLSKEEAIEVLGCKPEAFSAAATRLIKKQRLISPWRGFYLILRPEDRVGGAPDPVLWIDPLMKYLGFDYRISLLRAAAFYGSSHQVSMVFQVIVPRQLRSFELGRQRIQFIYQDPMIFERVNLSDWLQQLKSDTGFAKVAGVELMLLDSMRYFHRAGGIANVAQIVHDLGGRAQPGKLIKVAAFYENSAVRRLGYLLDRFGHPRQARALAPFARQAKSTKSLDPSSTALDYGMNSPEKDSKWMLTINESVEIDL
jgi:predicted transcriptional regulator of viral defense system